MSEKKDGFFNGVKRFAEKVIPDADDVKETLETVGGKVSGIVDGAKDKAQEVLDKTDIDEKIVEGAKKVKGKAEEALEKTDIDDKIKAKAEGVKDAFQEKFQRNEETGDGGKEKDTYVKNKKDMIFKSGDSLQQVVNVVNEAAAALEDKTRTIKESSIPEVLAGALGAGVGGVASFAALYALGTAGLSAAGITSGLAAAGAVVGGGMVAGVFVLAAPVAALSVGAYAVANSVKMKQLREEKERLYKEALAKHEGIIRALKEENDATQERLDYLESLNVLLEKAIEDLSKDLGIANE